MQLFGWIVAGVVVGLLVVGWVVRRVDWKWGGALSLGAGISARLGGVIVLAWTAVTVAGRGGAWLLVAVGLGVIAVAMVFSAALLVGGLVILVRHPERFE